MVLDGVRLADVADARVGETEEVARVELDRMLMVAAGADDPVAVDRRMSIASGAGSMGPTGGRAPTS